MKILRLYLFMRLVSYTELSPEGVYGAIYYKNYTPVKFPEDWNIAIENMEYAYSSK